MPKTLISSIVVQGLFGLYSYRLPVQGQLTDAVILYGDNGQGKSTILRLAFHLLSAGSNRGHRDHLFHAAFKSLEVRLGSGAILRAEKESEDNAPMRLSIERRKKILAVWRYLPHKLREQVFLEERYSLFANARQKGLLFEWPPEKKEGPPEGEEVYLEALKSVVPAAFILNADRRLDSDVVPDPSDEVEMRRYMRIGETRRIHDLVTRSREIALSQALASADKWINQKVFQGAQRGSTNVHAVYSNVVRQVVGRRPRKPEKSIDIAAMSSRLTNIEKRSAAYAEYGLATPLATKDFLAALESKSQNKRGIAVEIMLPYIESLEKRFEALDTVYAIVDRFVTTINGFLRDKTMVYSPGAGFRLVSSLNRTLEPRQLSSGEQQLLLLFCYVLTGRDTPSVFMIDEPEISLNVKWQRRLVTSLLELTDRDRTQFIFATHSIELLAQHRNRVVRLVPGTES